MAEFFLQNCRHIQANGVEKPIVQFFDKQTGSMVGEWRQPFVLTYCAKPVGVKTYTISKNGVTIVSSPETAGSVDVVYGDTLQIFATADDNYAQPTATLSQSTVKTDVTANVVAGVYTPPEDEYCAECGEKGYHWCACCASWHSGSC